MRAGTGYILLHRKLIESRVFKNEGLLKVWTWCLLKANHKENWVLLVIGKGTTEVKVGPGQFIFGRNSAAQELQMCSSTVWKRIKKLEKLGNLNCQSNTHYSIITIVNWDTYQIVQEKSDSQRDSQGTGKGQPGNTDKNENNDNNISPRIFSLRSRYSNQDIIDQAFTAIRSTRKSNKIADSVVLRQLERWSKYPTTQVEAGIKVYLDKKCADEGKDERYLAGIIHHSKLKPTTKPLFDDNTQSRRKIDLENLFHKSE